MNRKSEDEGVLEIFYAIGNCANQLRRRVKLKVCKKLGYGGIWERQLAAFLYYEKLRGSVSPFYVV